MLPVHRLTDLDAEGLKHLTRRPRIDFEAVFATVRPLIEAVRADGDAAVRRLTAAFDGVEPAELLVPVRPPEAIPLPEPVKAAFRTAHANISAFHAAQAGGPLVVETMPGVVCRREARPIEAVGLYVPGGTAVLPSSVLMLGVPARLAGCRTIIVATPPRPDGSVAPEVEYAAALCGIPHILSAGGAQAVAALAYGTESVPKVDKILGPGNQYVTAAKMLLQNSDAMVAIDMPAGPSEVLVVAGPEADPRHVAADLLSQAEHGADSQAVLVALPGFPVAAMGHALRSQLGALPRADAAGKALAHSFVVEAADAAQAAVFVDAYAPEHLILNLPIDQAEAFAARISHAGSVFLGPWTPESVGDYASGTNHTLPTYGFARMYSGVSLDSFRKQMTLQTLTPEGLRLLGPAVITMAETEGLHAHAEAVRIRLHDQA